MVTLRKYKSIEILNNFDFFKKDNLDLELNIKIPADARAICRRAKVKQSLTETLELPGVVPYPEDGRLATDHRRPSTFLTLAKANWLGETLGESRGLTFAPGL